MSSTFGQREFFAPSESSYFWTQVDSTLKYSLNLTEVFKLSKMSVVPFVPLLMLVW